MSDGELDQLSTGVRIFLINLEEDQDRLATMDEQLSRLGLSYERFAAFRGTEIPPWLQEQFFDAHGRQFAALGAGEIGCYASHLAVCRKVADENLEGPVLVLEDDVEIGPNLDEVLAALDRLPTDWEIVRCINPPRSAFVPLVRLTEGVEVIRYWRIPVIAGAYLINRAGAVRFLSSLPRRQRPVDDDLRRFWETGLITYGLVPPPVLARPYHSRESAIARMGGRKTKTRDGRVREKAVRLAAALELHGPSVGIRCILANFAASVLRRAGASDLALKMLRVVPGKPHSGWDKQEMSTT